MSYTIEFTASAARELRALEHAIQRRIATHIDSLANAPIPPGSKKLQGEPGLYRIRVGDYRILYRVDGKRVTILIVKVGHRRDVYR
jgi:mRNA interferase RelE/StbE